MKASDIQFSVGTSGYVHRDLMAIKGGARPNGFVFDGAPVLPGYRRVVEPGTTVSVLLMLDDGQIAFGDCADVILAGVAGRDRVFIADEHMSLLTGEMRDVLLGLDVSSFRANAERIDRHQVGGRPIHMALRYGLTQALLHAAALTTKRLPCEIIAQEYGCRVASAPVPILASGHRDDPAQLDRMILKRVGLLPHASFNVVADHVGLKGEKLVAFAKMVAMRIGEIGDTDYRPRIHLDVYGTLGELFANDTSAIADYIGTLGAAAQPFGLLVESPIIAKSRPQQAELFSALKTALRRKGIEVGIIVDEWANTLDDIKYFADAGAADFIQVKTPDLGGLNNTIEALIYCKSRNMGACLGGTGNETDQSARLCVHIGLACRPDFMLSKPGLGFDEAFMVQTNEMARTLTLLAARSRSVAGAAPRNRRAV
jgi:methylaspartate ammonia-lyase